MQPILDFAQRRLAVYHSQQQKRTILPEDTLTNCSTFDILPLPCLQQVVQNQYLGLWFGSALHAAAGGDMNVNKSLGLARDKKVQSLLAT